MITILVSPSFAVFTNVTSTTASSFIASTSLLQLLCYHKLPYTTTVCTTNILLRYSRYCSYNTITTIANAYTCNLLNLLYHTSKTATTLLLQVHVILAPQLTVTLYKQNSKLHLSYRYPRQRICIRETATTLYLNCRHLKLVLQPLLLLYTILVVSFKKYNFNN